MCHTVAVSNRGIPSRLTDTGPRECKIFEGNVFGAQSEEQPISAGTDDPERQFREISKNSQNSILNSIELGNVEEFENSKMEVNISLFSLIQEIRNQEFMLSQIQAFALHAMSKWNSPSGNNLTIESNVHRLSAQSFICLFHLKLILQFRLQII